ncbi:MAG: FAD-binding oxidoreductase [Caldilineales bacterium]|nr:FAD-binding oxidoreductase [Caldilineales bacterium]
MVTRTGAEVVICGAGIAGIAAAFHLAVERGLTDVVVVDERPPLTLTSDKSTEAYRNWWPGPGDAMVSLMNRSIDLMEEMAGRCDNRFLLNRRGYVYATADPARIPSFMNAAAEAESLGAGPTRIHRGQMDDPDYLPAPDQGYLDQPTGADIFLDPALIRQHFPYLTTDTLAVIHARRCGWFSGQQLGIWMLEQAQAAGVRLLEGRVKGVETAGGRVVGVRIQNAGGASAIPTGRFVNAAGPFLAEVGRMLDVDLPVFSELHLKVNFNDHRRVLPRHAPMLIWADPQRLNWADEEAEVLAEMPETRWLLNEFPPAIHCRPEGHGDSPWVLMLWPYHTHPVPETFPIPDDPDYAEVTLRGMARFIPGLSVYLDHMPKPAIDGGYYTKTRENRPLIGPLPVEGAYVIGALSGYGLMAAAAAGELLAAHIVESALPSYAADFHLARYDDPAYQALLENWGDAGQL